MPRSATSTTLLAVLFVLTAVASAFPAEYSDVESPATETIPDAEWEVQAFPNGEVLLMAGTVEKIWDQLLAINPNYVADWGIDDPEGSDENDNGSSLTKRTDFTGSRTTCERKGRADAYFISKGIKYLRAVQGRPRNGAGPGNCGRVSCSERSAIYWCNDERTPKTLASFGSIADGAQWVHFRCSWTGDSGVYSYVGGRTYHPTNWNVWMVRMSFDVVRDTAEYLMRLHS